MQSLIAVVTGASSGIGAATARTLAQQGYHVFCVARRADRIQQLAAEIDGTAVVCDVANDGDICNLVTVVGKQVHVLINNAGGALGQDFVANSNFDQWQQMYASNVVGAAKVTKALLPAISAVKGTVVFVTSTAAEASYEGGAGYCAAKAAERAVVGSLRLELCGSDVRVVEIAPGMVHTDEFSLTRFSGDQAKADAVYQGVPAPLVAEDIAECVRWTVQLPAHVNIDRMVVRPVAQAANHKVYRTV